MGANATSKMLTFGAFGGTLPNHSGKKRAVTIRAVPNPQ